MDSVPMKINCWDNRDRVRLVAKGMRDNSVTSLVICCRFPSSHRWPLNSWLQHVRDSFIVLPQPFGSVPEILPDHFLGQGGSQRPCKGLTLTVRSFRARDTGLVSVGK